MLEEVGWKIRERRVRMNAMQVYISYSPADQELARELASQLSEAGFEPWFDQDLLPGDNLQLENGKALEHSEAMVVLVSPESARSKWVRNEIQFALGSLQYANRLIPVQVRPTSEMPWILGRFPMVAGDGDVAEVGRRVLDRLRDAIQVVH
jgi:hypothetical protein